MARNNQEYEHDDFIILKEGFEENEESKDMSGKDLYRLYNSIIGIKAQNAFLGSLTEDQVLSMKNLRELEGSEFRLLHRRYRNLKGLDISTEPKDPVYHNEIQAYDEDPGYDEGPTARVKPRTPQQEELIEKLILSVMNPFDKNGRLHDITQQELSDIYEIGDLIPERSREVFITGGFSAKGVEVFDHRRRLNDKLKATTDPEKRTKVQAEIDLYKENMRISIKRKGDYRAYCASKEISTDAGKRGDNLLINMNVIRGSENIPVKKVKEVWSEVLTPEDRIRYQRQQEIAKGIETINKSALVTCGQVDGIIQSLKPKILFGDEQKKVWEEEKQFIISGIANDHLREKYKEFVATLEILNQVSKLKEPDKIVDLIRANPHLEDKILKAIPTWVARDIVSAKLAGREPKSININSRPISFEKAVQDVNEGVDPALFQIVVTDEDKRRRWSEAVTNYYSRGQQLIIEIENVIDPKGTVSRYIKFEHQADALKFERLVKDNPDFAKKVYPNKFLLTIPAQHESVCRAALVQIIEEIKSPSEAGSSPTKDIRFGNIKLVSSHIKSPQVQEDIERANGMVSYMKSALQDPPILTIAPSGMDAAKMTFRISDPQKGERILSDLHDQFCKSGLNVRYEQIPYTNNEGMLTLSGGIGMHHEILNAIYQVPEIRGVHHIDRDLNDKNASIEDQNQHNQVNKTISKVAQFDPNNIVEQAKDLLGPPRSRESQLSFMDMK